MDKGSAADRVRVGRDEREQCVEVLQEHYAAGRLGDAELGDRIGTALTATTRCDLRLLLEDLPGGSPAVRRRRVDRPFVATLGAALLVGVVAVGAGLSGATADAGSPVEWSYCQATGVSGDPNAPCPEVGPVQQQIFADADAAERSAQQLAQVVERNPDAGLSGLLERGVASSGRAQDALLRAQQIVLVADGEPSKKVLQAAADDAARAAAEADEALDAALERLDR